MTAESCKKKTTPLVTTANVTEITSTSAKSGGNVTDDGNAAVTERGVCWSTTQNPTTSSNKTSDGSGVGTFTSNLTGLTSNTTYYVRAYATNSEGTAYGNELSFTTQCQLPSATTNAASDVTGSSATLNGTVNASGSSTTVTFEYGLTTSYGSSVTATQSPLTGSSNTVVSAAITGLTPGTTYHYRVKAVNCGGTVNGTDQTFTTSCPSATATTNAASGVGNTTATLNGTVNAKGTTATVTFEYGLTTSYGSTVTATPSPVTGSSNTDVSASVTGLTPGTTYHFRVKAVNCGGTVNGSDQTFTTSCPSATATTNPATGVTYTTATLNGTVNANGSSTTVTFEYGLTTAYGSTVTATQSPVTGSSNTAVSASITELIPGATYHYRVKAVNCGGTITGTDRQFTTPEAKSSLHHTGIIQTNVDLNTRKTLGQITINPSVSGKVIVSFDGVCFSSPGDRIVLAASNTTNWVSNDGNVHFEAFDSDLNTNAFSHTRVYDVTPGSHTFYAVGQNYVETDGDGLASIYGSLTVQFIPSTSGSIVGFSGIIRPNVNVTSTTTVGSVTINPSVPGKAIVKFDGVCVSSPGDRIILAASNTSSWYANDGSVSVEVPNSDIDRKSFCHTRVYDVSPGSNTFNAVVQNS
ncbi:MAG: fibronectin type III domain-containing protein, partial [Bacteroidales bacterium]|nr:fibronectin type III domain-containing protein [Bacteroidales bacterium]